MAIYLDCNATTPIEPEVAKVIHHYLLEDFGNAGSRTHELGNRAKKAVEEARRKVASLVDCKAHEVLFTSGATESNNIAILGLMRSAEATERKHIITTAIEHKAVLEPVQRLKQEGIVCTIIKPNSSGRISPEQVLGALRKDTLLVSVMQANNETGVLQPIEEIANALSDTDAYFHVDAAQGFGKDIGPLRSKHIDFISISGHKIFGPKGIGALIIKKRKDGTRVKLQPIMYGGGQEQGLRPGTLPVHLIAGLGKASEIALRDHKERWNRCLELRTSILDAFAPMGILINGSIEHALPNVINFSVPGIDSEAAILAWKGIAEVSNGSACTSASYDPSHVLKAMGIDEEQIEGALRLSWCHMTPDFKWDELANSLRDLL